MSRWRWWTTATPSLVTALLARGYRVETLLEDRDSAELATVRLAIPPHSDVPLLLDLLVGTSGIEREVVAAATVETVISTVRLPVARLGHLLAMKVLADRPGRENDASDIRRLIEAADDDELDLARQALDLMTSRGRNREKDLSAAFQTYLGRAGR